MSKVRHLSEDEVLAWARQPGSRLFRYQVQSGPIAFLLGTFLVSLGATGVFYWVETKASETLFAISLGISVWTLFKLVTTFLTIGRRLVGLSDSELLLVRNNRATLIPYESISDNGFTDAEKLTTTRDYLRIVADGEVHKLKTMNLYLQMNELPDFLATFLDKTDASAANS